MRTDTQGSDIRDAAFRSSVNEPKKELCQPNHKINKTGKTKFHELCVLYSSTNSV